MKWTQAREWNTRTYKNTLFVSADTMYEISDY